MKTLRQRREEWAHAKLAKESELRQAKVMASNIRWETELKAEDIFLREVSSPKLRETHSAPERLTYNERSDALNFQRTPRRLATMEDIATAKKAALGNQVIPNPTDPTPTHPHPQNRYSTKGSSPTDWKLLPRSGAAKNADAS